MRHRPFAAAIVVVICCGIVHGYWTERWGSPRELAEAVDRLNQFAFSIGDWEGETIAADPRQFKTVAGYSYRRYVNRMSGRVIFVVLECGRSGPVAVHTPDVCYGASGYESAAPVRHAIDYSAASDASSRRADFSMATFRKAGAPESDQLHVLWCWKARGNWTAPDNPRVTFARQRNLYKLYVTWQGTAVDDTLPNEGCIEFLRLLLEELDQSLARRFDANRSMS